MDIKDIIEQFQTLSTANDVFKLSEYKVQLSGEYAFYSGKMATIEITKAEWWQTFRDQYKSDTSTERAWQITKEGQAEIKIKRLLKSVEKMLSALNQRIAILREERHQI